MANKPAKYDRPWIWQGPIATTLLLIALSTSSAQAAEQLSIRGYGGQRSISVAALEEFVNSDEIPRELRWYADRMTEEQLEGLRVMLQEPLNVEPRVVSTFTNDSIGEALLRRLTGIFWGGTDESNFRALRSTLVVSAYSDEGLTLLNAIRNYPLSDLRINLSPVLDASEELKHILVDSGLIFERIQLQAGTGVTDPEEFLVSLPSPSLAGDYSWTVRTLELTNPQRSSDQQVLADVYIPDNLVAPAPLVVISHGVASSRNTFIYLAEHLASHGFAVATLEHPSSDATRFQDYIAGFAKEPEPRLAIQRPLDITALLDELENLTANDPAWQGQIRTDDVGVMGQSLGGYTALAAGGAQFDLDYLGEVCEDSERTLLPFNLSLLLQCKVLQLTDLELQPVQDERVAAVLAVNPVSSSVFGPEGLGQMEVPVMMVAGTNDFFAPAVSEQIEPFIWLGAEEKFLVLVENGTHFTFLPGAGADDVFNLPQELIGPDPTLGHPALKALATVFLTTYLTDETAYEPYLTEFLLPSRDGEAFNYALTGTLTESDIEDALYSGE